MSNEELHQAIARRIIKARSQTGMSQNDLADKSGIAAAQISRYEKGRNTPRPEVLAKLAIALNVEFDWLRFGEADSEAVESVGLKRFPSDEADKYLHRFAEPGMREKLKELAKKSGRKTLTAEINAVLLAHIENGGNIQSQTVALSEADMNKLADKVVSRLKD